MEEIYAFYISRALVTQPWAEFVESFPAVNEGENASSESCGSDALADRGQAAPRRCPECHGLLPQFKQEGGNDVAQGFHDRLAEPRRGQAGGKPYTR
jgi:hypothetical protein